MNPTGILGGAEMCLLDLLASFQAAGLPWSPHVILSDDGPLRPAINHLGVDCRLLPFPPALAGLGDAGLGGGRGGRRLAAGLALLTRGPAAGLAVISYLRQLRRTLAELRPDLVQTNGMKAHLLGTLAAPRGVPVVWHMHDFCGSRALMARLLRGVLRLRRGPVHVVGVSQAVAANAAQILGAATSVEAVYNAVDLDRFTPRRGDEVCLDLDAIAGLPSVPDGTVRIGLVATYARWKGHDVFLDAVARVDRTLPARFYIVGGPLYRTGGSQFTGEELRARVAALGLEGRVGFVPHQPAPEAAFQALDVVVHASTRPEPFGRVIVEAMACGKAVIAANAGGASELFEDGVSALGCPPGDPEALASAMTRLITDVGLRRSLGEAGRRHAEADFDRAGLARTWSRVYDRALVPGSRPSGNLTGETVAEAQAHA
ncbi:MAG: glycosyltransferase family 4 protein [Isosphaeraceae bacterium]